VGGGVEKNPNKTKATIQITSFIYGRLDRLPNSAGRWILQDKDGNCVLGLLLRRTYHPFQ